MKKVLVILVLFLLGCGNQSEKSKESNQFPTTSAVEDSTNYSESNEEEIYEGYPKSIHIFLNKKDNNILLTKYCPEKDFTEGKIIDEGFVKYHSDSNGIAIKTEFIGNVLLNYDCIRYDDKVLWYSPQTESINGIDSISITLFEDWEILGHRNIFQSSISYFGKTYHSDFDEFEVNDIIQAITMSGCSEEMIPYVGCCLKVDSISCTLWDIISISKKYPFKTCKLKNINDERGIETMLLYENLAKNTENNLSLIYKNNKLTSIILGGSGVISENPYLDLVDKVIKRDSIPLMYGN